MINFKKIKSYIKVILGKEYPFKCEIQLNKKWIGNDYGGFYVASDFLNQESVIYSFGIGEDISFDTKLIGLYSCIVHGFDPTPRSISWINLNTTPNKFIFHDYGIDIVNGEKTFFLPENTNFVSGSIHQTNHLKTKGIKVQMRNLETICNELGHSKIDVLKIDIEGSEYDIIPYLLSMNLPIDQLLIEFHHRFFEDGFSKTKEVLAMLRNNGYKLFGVSDSMQEISFIKNNK